MRRAITAAFIFGLPGTLAAQAAPRSNAGAPETAAGNPDKIVCKRFIKTGSLVEGYRTCRTKKAWERERDDVKQMNWSSRVDRPRAASARIRPKELAHA